MPKKRNPYSTKAEAPLESLTKIEAEKESKRRAGEMAEVIDTLGQESTLKALPHIQEKQKVEDQEAQEELATNLNTLDSKRLWQKNYPHADPYRRELVRMIIYQISNASWPKGYHFKALPTEEGVALLVMSPDQKIYGHGFKPSMLVDYDLNAVNVLVMQAENLVERLETEKRRGNKPNGIILPN